MSLIIYNYRQINISQILLLLNYTYKYNWHLLSIRSKTKLVIYYVLQMSFASFYYTRKVHISYEITIILSLIGYFPYFS